MLRQVRIVSILMIVNGALLSCVGILLLIAFVLRSTENRIAGRQQEGRNILAGDSVFYLLFGFLILVAAALNVLGGVSGFWLRHRGLAMTALLCNLLTLPTLMLAPTSLGLMIYGIFVFTNRQVVRAFKMVAEGMPVAEVLRGSLRGYRAYDADDEDDGYER